MDYTTLTPTERRRLATNAVRSLPPDQFVAALEADVLDADGLGLLLRELELEHLPTAIREDAELAAGVEGEAAPGKSSGELETRIDAVRSRLDAGGK